jgi:hypothetical protein
MHRMPKANWAQVRFSGTNSPYTLRLAVPRTRARTRNFLSVCMYDGTPSGFSWKSFRYFVCQHSFLIFLCSPLSRRACPVGRRRATERKSVLLVCLARNILGNMCQRKYRQWPRYSDGQSFLFFGPEECPFRPLAHRAREMGRWDREVRVRHRMPNQNTNFNVVTSICNKRRWLHWRYVCCVGIVRFDLWVFSVFRLCARCYIYVCM